MNRRPSGPWSNAVAIAAFCATSAMVIVLLEFLRFGSSGQDSPAALLPLVGFAVVVAAAFRLFAPLPWRVRSALALPVVHLGLGVTALAVWKGSSISAYFPPLATADLPGIGFGAAAGGAVLALALAHQSLSRHRRTPRWLRPTIVALLGYLFSLGIALPVLATTVAAPSPWLVLVVPVAPALLAVVLPVPRGAAVWWVAAGATLVAALFASRANEAALVTHASYLEVTIGLGALIVGALVALAVAQWRELRVHRAEGGHKSPWVQTGVAQTTDGSPAAIFRFCGWLRGFRAEVREFTIAGGQMPVRVPAGSTLRAPLPPASVDAEPGDAFLALGNGAPVIAAGYETVANGAPYRTGAGVVPGDAGIAVSQSAHPSSLHGVALLLWRPCTLYLAAATAVMIPFLVTVLAFD